MNSYSDKIDSNKFVVDGHSEALLKESFVRELVNEILLNQADQILKDVDQALNVYSDSLKGLDKILKDTERL